MKRYFGMRIGKHLCAVWVLGEGNTGFLSPRLSLRMFSATGFGWGDDGPPAQQAQLALALLCDAYAEYIESRAVVRRLGATYESRVFKASTRRADDADADVEEELEGQPHGGALLRRRATPGDDDFDAGEWSVIIRPRPEVKMASDAWRRVQRMLTEFGMTASSRSKLYVAMAEAEGDPFAEWERGGRSAS